MTEPTLSKHAIHAIVHGYHGDPFAVLGPHQVEDGVAVRAFLPQTTAVTLHHANAQYPMRKLDDAGFYEAFISNASLPFDYDLQIDDAPLRTDPYAYPALLSDYDQHLLVEGTHVRSYDRLGAHVAEINGRTGVVFSVWAPGALRVSVIGEFNNWDGRRHPMRFHHDSGIWELFLPDIGVGTLYKYEIKTRYKDYTVAKTDPVGFYTEMRPNTASIVWDIDQYQWQDSDWIAKRPRKNAFDAPISVYEVHLASWKHKLNNGVWEWLTYTDLAESLIPYVKEMGYTHIELMPVSEYPYDGSWGYQVTGYFAPTSRFGTPDEFMAFVDACHRADIGVILDWVPAHFPKDAHGLSFFDGTHLYEHADPRQGTQPDWGTLVFNYGRHEVRQFLISNALFWIDKYHIDGLRVDAVASMLYLDFSREEGQWVPNRFGGRENLEAIAFLREFNNRVHELYPGAITVAEESTAFPGVTKATPDGGLGFDMKWNMGWMHDSLRYMSNEPIHRSYHQGALTFSLLYAFSEKFQLPFSHDEVVHLKKSMLDKMPGDRWQKFANLRLLYGYQWGHPGKKLLFMGGEFGQWREWAEDRSLDWDLLDKEDHKGLQHFMRDLNRLYQAEPALYEDDASWEGFSWIDFRDGDRSILSFSRTAPSTGETVLVVCNFTPIVRDDYWMGVPEEGSYTEILNSDAAHYGGSDVTNDNPIVSDPKPLHELEHSIRFTLPPLAAVFLKKSAE